jgi:LCP family protein required for cell wall assembly
VSNGDPELQDGFPEIPVFNGDFFREPDPEPEVPEVPRQKPAAKRRRKKARGCCLGCLGMLLIPVMLVVVLLAGVLGLRGPDAVDQTFPRKANTSTILLVGTDAAGERTDTMILLYLSGSEKRVGMLSLPRDTYTITSSGSAAKLNSAYIRNGQGKKGMDGLLDYVQDIIGYRPDGYMMVSMDIVPQIVDVMGGLTVDVPMSFELEGVALEEGVQTLNGKEVLQLLRYRKGYAMQDLGRVEVQRMVIGAAMEQWIRPDRVRNALDALNLVQKNCLTDLELTDFAWVAKTILLGRDRLQSHTLPGWAGYIGDASYYILYKDEVAALINESYNPFTTKISVDQLNIAG